MHVMIAAGTLKEGVSEEALLAASARFQREFAAAQPGVLRRVLVGSPSGRYADIIFFADEDTIRGVGDAEQHNEAYHEFMSTMDFDDVVVYRALQVNE